jgi:hypothetical protein
LHAWHCADLETKENQTGQKRNRNEDETNEIKMDYMIKALYDIKNGIKFRVRNVLINLFWRISTYTEFTWLSSTLHDANGSVWNHETRPSPTFSVAGKSFELSQRRSRRTMSIDLLFRPNDTCFVDVEDAVRPLPRARLHCSMYDKTAGEMV